MQKVHYPQIRRQLISWKCKPLASDRINCPLRATERHYSTKLKCNIQSLMSDGVTLICRVMLPSDLLSLIHLTQFTPISCSLQLSQWLTYSGLCYSLSSAWGPHIRHSEIRPRLLDARCQLQNMHFSQTEIIWAMPLAIVPIGHILNSSYDVIAQRVHWNSNNPFQYIYQLSRKDE